MKKALLMLLTLAAAALAQSNVAGITGIVTDSSGAVVPGEFDAIGHCKASMLAAREPDRWLIELHFDLEQKLWRVEPTFFMAAQMSEAEKGAVAVRVDSLRAQRLDRVITQQGKIGRNQLCTCGSGKKYKRCCGM